ncbi:Lrp/AsnC family transcriptional regulator [Microbulbifer flavimaris]|jgi:Lrp/AsnC family leucine-responsive transcriptional regulator|uniref:Lrp/AsnC family transcriptional regulator n=1 Tax=Microbulbifer flavimaris TaxID=1781068 RepID=A0ABX4I2F7_9GAMM|nr:MULTISPECIES: Lrp/AsnC family transcriptional regulator [Microbulbifer]KUJ84513.1 AsnC family transcriptional regulator [Microbulbifer sp. ZGT114]PCO06600.1 Lrp/AsnC family transcriptional regulator [Microbulbifer flavimaris]
MVSSISSLDRTDIAILRVLQAEGRISNVELSDRVHLSPPATLARVRRLEEEGYISGYAAMLNREKLGHDNLALIEIALELHQYERITEVLDQLVAMPEVLECYHVTGEYDYMIKVSTVNNRALDHFIAKRLIPLPGIARIHTSIVLKALKQTTELDLPEP